VLDVLPHDSRCLRPASRLETLLPEPRRPDREKEAATLKIQARIRGNAARRHAAAEEARRSAAKAAAEARKEEEEARAAEAAAELEWGDVTKAERELKRAELSGDQARVAAAKEALAKELAEAEEAQAKADQERAEAEEAHEAHEDAEAASLKVASEAVLATVNASGNEGGTGRHSSLGHEHSPSANRRMQSTSPGPLEVSLQEELAALRDTITEERTRREAAERRAEKAEVLVATLSAELEQRAQAVASAADMRAAEAERRAASAEERAMRAHATISATETMVAELQAQQGNGPSATGSHRQSSYKTRPWSGKGNGSSWQRSAKEPDLSNDVSAGVVGGGGQWIGVNHRNLFA
jgi:colicin import membrane protein